MTDNGKREAGRHFKTSRLFEDAKSKLRSRALLRLTSICAGLESMQVVGGSLRVTGGGEDGALVGFQHLQPVVKIGRVVVTNLRRDAEISAQERAAQFGDQFFGGV